MPGVFSDEFAAPSASADAVHVTFPDGTVVEYEPKIVSEAAVMEKIDTELPAELRPVARIYATKAKIFERANPFVDQIGALFNKSPAQISAAWSQAPVV